MAYKYDNAGNRIKKQTDSMVTYYINQYYDLESAVTKRHIFAGSEKVATIEGPAATATTAYHHTDHLSGSSVETDKTGAVLELTDYHPFGTTRFDKTATSYTGNDYKFTGKELDSDSGLYYYGARYYNPALGRFVSEDPAVQEVRPEFLLNPQSLNSYSYVMNNPLKYIDPTGEFAILALFAPLFMTPIIGEVAIGLATIGIGIYSTIKLWQMADKAIGEFSQTRQGQARTQGDSKNGGNSGQKEPNNKNPLAPEKIATGTAAAQQAAQNFQDKIDKSLALVESFGKKGIGFVENNGRFHGAERIIMRAVERGITPEKVLQTMQNGTKYSDRYYPETINYISKFEDQFIRVVTERSTGLIKTVVEQPRLTDRFSPIK